jgi:hypothetical protein
MQASVMASYLGLVLSAAEFLHHLLNRRVGKVGN